MKPSARPARAPEFAAIPRLPVFVLLLAVLSPAARAAGAWDACLGAPTETCLFDEALRSADGVKDDGQRAVQFANLADTQAKAGMTAAAAKSLQVATGLAPTLAEASRDRALTAIAIAQADASDFTNARQTAQTIAGAEDKSGVFATIAVAQNAAGLAKDAAASFESALGAAQSLTGGARASALATIGTLQARAGLGSLAAQTFAEAALVAQDPRPGHSEIWLIALRQAEAGQVDAALATADLESDAVYRDVALEAVVEARAKAEQIVEALATARTISYAPLRAKAFAAIAVAHAKAGQQAQAELMLEQAERAAKSAPGDTGRASGLVDVALGQARSGLAKQASANFDAARQIIQSLPSESDRTAPTWSLAKALAKAGRYDEAMAAAASMPTTFLVPATLAEIAQDQEDGGKFADALRTLERIDRNSANGDIARLGGLLKLAPKLPQ